MPTCSGRANTRQRTFLCPLGTGTRCAHRHPRAANIFNWNTPGEISIKTSSKTLIHPSLTFNYEINATTVLFLLHSLTTTMAPASLPSSKTYSIAAIPADGIGPEVIAAGIEVLNALASRLQSFELEFTHYDWSSEKYKKTGKYLPDDALAQLRKHDAIFFGAVGARGMYYFLAAFVPLAPWFTCARLAVGHAKSPVDELTSSPDRCSRPHLALGTASCNLPTPPAICQRSPNPYSARHLFPSA